MEQSLNIMYKLWHIFSGELVMVSSEVYTEPQVPLIPVKWDNNSTCSQVAMRTELDEVHKAHSKELGICYLINTSHYCSLDSVLTISV